MITEISFDNFKCLSKKGPFYLSKLNVFSGYNGRGKSSVMQFLLMLSQSIRKDQNQIRKLHLNGDYVNLGDFDEIMTDDYGENWEQIWWDKYHKEEADKKAKTEEALKC